MSDDYRYLSTVCEYCSHTNYGTKDSPCDNGQCRECERTVSKYLDMLLRGDKPLKEVVESARGDLWI